MENQIRQPSSFRDNFSIRISTCVKKEETVEYIWQACCLICCQQARHEVYTPARFVPPYQENVISVLLLWEYQQIAARLGGVCDWFFVVDSYFWKFL